MLDLGRRHFLTLLGGRVAARFAGAAAASPAAGRHSNAQPEG
jgi:hypothetical protein